MEITEEQLSKRIEELEKGRDSYENPIIVDSYQEKIDLLVMLKKALFDF